MKKINYFLAPVLALFMSGCCSLFVGTTQEVTIDSKPQEAKIYDAQGNYLGVTPAKITFPRGKNTTLKLKKEGYDDGTVFMNRNVEWWPFVLDILLWPTMIVDYATGAMFKYDSAYIADLPKAGSTK
ncbi:PEGA domain-containing protein [Lentisphaerota bacterium ZTH]|nr:PEGA domain-containing protein [Lentisphaerota bacterium]WET06174.1 PEGA domain-containing protein [Lentisphaerota bacterium ZTH]